MAARQTKRTPRGRRNTDTSDYVGYRCEICGRPVRLSHHNGFWRRNKDGAITEAAHVDCKFPIR